MTRVIKVLKQILKDLIPKRCPDCGRFLPPQKPKRLRDYLDDKGQSQ